MTAEVKVIENDAIREVLYVTFYQR